MPDQYVVYSTTLVETDHQDDACVGTRTYVYLDLWSVGDPTEMADQIRRRMYAAGFYRQEDSDKGYNYPAYSTATNRFVIQWTWVCFDYFEDDGLGADIAPDPENTPADSSGNQDEKEPTDGEPNDPDANLEGSGGIDGNGE
ncbi:MAG: hypothetical protein IJ649_02660 [Oscillospiraceae bacterium]|nr:hypothetical protein [Oscillospiraceae bacterium]